MINPQVRHVAQALLAARRDRAPCDADFFAQALRDPADAYAVQDLVMEGVTQQQGFPRYWKTGAPGRDGVAPHAALPPEGVWASPADAYSWAFNICLVEAEIAFRLAHDVPPAQAAALDRDTARAVVDAMAVSIELVDSRWREGLAAPALLKLADLQSHGALVLGPWVPFVERDWAAQECTVQIGIRPVAFWRGTHAVGDPVALVPAWLRHASRRGETVPAGTVVTTGTWCGMLPSAPGDRVVVRFEAVGESVVQL